MSTVEYKKTFFKIADFVSWQKEKTLVLSPKFQRRSVWSSGAKSYLIDTIVRNLPIPIIFLRDLPVDLDTLKAVREVVDGQQRLRTVLSFVVPSLLDDYNPKNDDFTVQKNHNPEIAGKSFQNLDNEIKQTILDYEFSVHILSPRMDDREVIEIFRRMNSIYYKLNDQELRNSQYFGDFKTLAYNLATESLDYWRRWNVYDDDDIARMKEVKLTSEIIIMMITKDLESSSKSKIDNFYKKYDSVLPQKGEIYNNFHLTMRIINDGFKDFLPSSIFSQQTKIYVFFALIYHLVFGLNDYPKITRSCRQLSQDNVQKIKKVCNELQHNKNEIEIDSKVIKAVNSRRQSITERTVIFEYLINKII
ncbi:DUF262 domain-containing protein [Synechocystis sp. PCC 7339]|uniref:DUF262 domain-containing protein n=1 Tax=unclassified Synechocystis TaxID=2640012 RepID=UPI001BAEBEB7|nr:MULTISPECIES: DUF262 domain-containing protein [unclassified Synechocystis]QUS60309.1 DUF262 domain-containing protein [Synechocystis sp. PCC 7338]UAJ72243.1 DUF262 domain-containing protein [Synechocystis sp. PCC 7339]